MSYDFNFDGILNYDDDQAVSPDTVIAEFRVTDESGNNMLLLPFDTEIISTSYYYDS